MATTFTFSFQAVLFHDQGQWIAQCLGVDVASHGDTLHAAKENLAKTLAESICLALHSNQAPFAGVPLAPARFFEMFKTAEVLRDKTPIFVPPAFQTNAEFEELRIAA